MDGSSGSPKNSSDVSPVTVLEKVRESMESLSTKSRPPSAAAGAAGGDTSSPVVSEEVCQSIKKGMRIISDIEQTRADGMVFNFELDLMYAVSKSVRSRGRV